MIASMRNDIQNVSQQQRLCGRCANPCSTSSILCEKCKSPAKGTLLMAVARHNSINELYEIKPYFSKEEALALYGDLNWEISARKFKDSKAWKGGKLAEYLVPKQDFQPNVLLRITITRPDVEKEELKKGKNVEVDELAKLLFSE